MKTILKHASSLLVAAMVSLLASAGVLAGYVDGKPAFDKNTDSGLYVWRTLGGDWQVRLISGDTGRQQFSGIFEASQPINIIKHIALESNDSVWLTEESRLDTEFFVYSGGVDGVVFAVDSGADLCLRGSGNSEAIVYLGRDAVPVTTPVDLSGTGECGSLASDTRVFSSVSPESSSSTLTGADFVSAPSDRKYNPGHYIAMMKWNTDDHPALIDSIKPGVVGFHKRYTWRELEPGFGKYDFSRVRRDLDLLAGQGMQLIAMIEDKSFRDEKYTPPYLWDEYTLPNRARNGGYTAKRWAPYVVERMNALMAAMAKQFDSHPNFEGIAFQESSLSLDKDVRTAAGYTPEKYRDALIEVLTGAVQNFPSSRVFWYMNFLVEKQAYIADVATAVAPHGVVMGGPDILPDDYSLNKHTYGFYDQFKGKMPLFCSAQNDSYRLLHQDTSSPTKYWTPGEIFRFARDELHVNYVFWTRKPSRTPSGAYSWLDALPVIERNPAFNY